MSNPAAPIIALLGGLAAYFIVKPKYKVVDLRGTFTPEHPTGWPYRPVEDITDVTIHHSAGGQQETVQGIYRYHVNVKRWKGIGYFVVIDPRVKTIYIVNEPTALSWHNGTNNRNALGICVMGNKEVRAVDEWTVNAIVWAVKKWRKQYNLVNLVRLVGHGEYRGHTQCPGRFMPVETLRNRLKMMGPNFIVAPRSLLSGFMASNEPDLYNPEHADH